MFEEFPVRDEARLLHAAMFVGQVIVPEAIIVVPVVNRLCVAIFVVLSDAFVHLSIRNPVEVSLDSLNLSIDLIVSNLLLFVHDGSTFRLSEIVVHLGKDLLRNRVVLIL